MTLAKPPTNTCSAATADGGTKRGRKPGTSQTVAAPAAQPQPVAASPIASPVDLIDKTLNLAKQAGGVAALKKLVDRLADVRAW